jgi:hypothetical protein
MKKNHQLTSSTISVATTFAYTPLDESHQKPLYIIKIILKSWGLYIQNIFLKKEKGQLFLPIRKKHSGRNKNFSQKKWREKILINFFKVK